MKKLILIIAAAVLLSALSNTPIRAVAGNYYTYNKVLSAKYLNMSHQALKNKNYVKAKMLARKAIRFDVSSKPAWTNYALIVAKMAGGKITSYNHAITVKSISTPQMISNKVCVSCHDRTAAWHKDRLPGGKFSGQCDICHNPYGNTTTFFNHTKTIRDWKKSVHKGVSCHECHSMTKVTTGKSLVPSSKCLKCHWKNNKNYSWAKKINHSNMHIIHYTKGHVGCAQCHGYIVHKFLPTARFCVKCHKNKRVHGMTSARVSGLAYNKSTLSHATMSGFACLNCHTDRTLNLLPDRAKCLFCHGNNETREKIIAGNTIDIQFFKPSEKDIYDAPKINVPKNAPMQFYCYRCHKPHTKLLPGGKTCLSCHKQILKVGKHKLHVKMLKLKCTKCHKPHIWKVTKKQAKITCAKCHAYKSPKSFIGS